MLYFRRVFLLGVIITSTKTHFPEVKKFPENFSRFFNESQIFFYFLGFRSPNSFSVTLTFLKRSSLFSCSNAPHCIRSSAPQTLLTVVFESSAPTLEISPSLCYNLSISLLQALHLSISQYLLPSIFIFSV